MKNKEKYIDDIIEIMKDPKKECSFRAKRMFRSEDGNCPNPKEMLCYECDVKFYQWLEEEYEPPKVNWEEVPYNTKVYVRDDEYSDWKLRTFVCYNPKYFDPFICVANVGKSAVSWKYAKLVDEEDIARFKKVN